MLAYNMEAVQEFDINDFIELKRYDIERPYKRTKHSIQLADCTNEKKEYLPDSQRSVSFENYGLLCIDDEEKDYYISLKDISSTSTTSFLKFDSLPQICIDE